MQAVIRVMLRDLAPYSTGSVVLRSPYPEATRRQPEAEPHRFWSPFITAAVTLSFCLVARQVSLVAPLTFISVLDQLLVLPLGIRRQHNSRDRLLLASRGLLERAWPCGLFRLVHTITLRQICEAPGNARYVIAHGQRA